MSLPINSLFSLTWGDYGTSLVSAVQLLRCHGDLVDVTLALAAGSRSLQAPKLPEENDERKWAVGDVKEEWLTEDVSSVCQTILEPT